MDVEELGRLGAWDRDFDCNGAAIPKRPWHPRNVLEVSGAPGFAVRPQVLPPDFSAVERRDASGLARKGKKKGEGKGATTSADTLGKGNVLPIDQAKYVREASATTSGGGDTRAPAGTGPIALAFAVGVAVGVAFALGRASKK